MLKLTVAGLGPIDTPRTLPLAGTLSKPSRWGKSTIVDAVCWALFGSDRRGNTIGAERVNRSEGVKGATARLEGEGLVQPVTRHITRKGSKSQRVGEATTSAKGVASLLGLAGQEDVARVVVAPLAWCGLHDTQRGRPLADMLAGLLPPVDVRAEVAAILAEGEAPVTLADDDPVDEDGAKALQKARNAAEAEARGAHAEREAVLAELTPPAEPTTGPEAEARAILARAADAADYAANMAERAAIETAHGLRVSEVLRDNERALAEHTAKVAALEATHAAAVAAHETAAADYAVRVQLRAAAVHAATSWASKRAGLGERPADPADTAGQVAQATAALAAAQQGVSFATRAVETAEAALAATPDVEPDSCPTCGQAWGDAADHERARLSARVETARAALAQAQAQVTTCEATLAQAEAATKGAAKQRALVAAWDAKFADIGPEPAAPGPAPAPPVAPGDQVLPPAPTPAPSPTRPPMPATLPEVVAPEPAAVARAQDAVEKWGTYRSDLARHEQQLTSARQAAVRARSKLSEAEAKAAHARALVAAVRAAPSRIAEAQAEHLGDLGPVTLRWGASATDQAVQVLVDGLPYHLASGGELRVADLHLRAAVRKLAGLDWLPIIVDEAQAWSGTWPAVDGALYLVTSKED